jgi:hypothetical protein
MLLPTAMTALAMALDEGAGGKDGLEKLVGGELVHEFLRLSVG